MVNIYTYVYIHTHGTHLNHARHTVAVQELVPFFTDSVFPGTLVVKNSPVDTGDIRDMGLIPGSRSSPGRGHGNPLQDSCLENPHGQRSLVSYSSWCKESYMTKRLLLSFSFNMTSSKCQDQIICMRNNVQGSTKFTQPR